MPCRDLPRAAAAPLAATGRSSEDPGEPTRDPLGIPRPGPTDLPPSGPHAAAPTVGLRLLAESLTVSNSSVTLNVNVPPGIVTSPTEVSVLYGVTRVTVNYDSARGTYIDVQFPPKDGARRQETLAITLTELTPERHHYSIVSQLAVEPKFDIAISELYVISDYEGACDAIGSADPRVFWMDPDGVQQRFDLYDSYGSVYTFDRSLARAGVSNGLTLPTLEWVDRDPGGFGVIGENALPRGPQLLPLAESIPAPDFSVGVVPVVRQVVEVLPDAGGDDCSAQLVYTVTYTLSRV